MDETFSINRHFLSSSAHLCFVQICVRFFTNIHFTFITYYFIALSFSLYISMENYPRDSIFPELIDYIVFIVSFRVRVFSCVLEQLVASFDFTNLLKEFMSNAVSELIYFC